MFISKLPHGDVQFCIELTGDGVTQLTIKKSYLGFIMKCVERQKKFYVLLKDENGASVSFELSQRVVSGEINKVAELAGQFIFSGATVTCRIVFNDNQTSVVAQYA